VAGVSRVATRWTFGEGLAALIAPEGYDVAFSTGVTDDGSTVVGVFSGRIGGGRGSQGIWTEALGPVEIGSYLASAGADTTGWTFADTPIINASGSAIAAGGFLDGEGGVFYLVTGLEIPTCPADLDPDHALTIFDFLAFGNLFDDRDPRADFDRDGDYTIFDFLAFQNAFDAGCE
jgi:hypothetical protein